MPINPPSASISLIRWPLPSPPMAGLHERVPISPISNVTIAALIPSLEAIVTASTPACPAPTTITSYFCFTWNIYLPIQNFLNIISSSSSLSCLPKISSNSYNASSIKFDAISISSILSRAKSSLMFIFSKHL